MRAGLIGTGAMARKHAQAFRNIGFALTVCTNSGAEKGRQFASDTGAEFVASVEEVCRHPEVDFVDLCTPPNYRLPAVELCAQSGKHVLVEKPMAADLATARAMIGAAREAGIQLGVISQHRFDESAQFLRKAIEAGRLGRILEADAYVKWYRSPEYYSRAYKGTWAGEGGGVLITQAIHQVDLLLYLAGPVRRVTGNWQIGALHAIESEDCLNALLRYESGAMGVIQASTAVWPGYPERIEIHGTKGTAIITGDKLTTWDVKDDRGEDAPLTSALASGASDPMAITTASLERQILDFARACRTGEPPLVSAVEGYRALELTARIYESCRAGVAVALD